MIRAFRAVRPQTAYASQVAALPYDVVTDEEARLYTKDNPYSFLNVDKAAYTMRPDQTPYEAAKSYLDWLLAEGVYEEDAIPHYYIYGLEVGDIRQYGIVGCFACAAYDEGRIKKHENTRADKEIDRIRHVEACQMHTGPIFLAYKEEKVLEMVIAHYRAYGIRSEERRCRERVYVLV